ncbi:von Willebrand factor D and EGF domain-containing protein-like [Mercenaria mercenaria]|uniref:von Willebrand factor D and EGF domain-containing protein-like n=1 Tax=Mercenaria mercenaria TaxID=6596 RepID=UPI00234F395E|nr:von Willebrand factor D and EGF domain-containing protein-like [Mercenaria mercenaria]
MNQCVLITGIGSEEAAYRPASAKINVPQADITNHSFTIIISYDHGSENLTGEGNLLLKDGSVIRSYSVDKPSLSKTFEGLTIGTKYIVEVHTYRHGQRTELDREWVFTQPGIEAYLQPVSTGKAELSSTAFRCQFHTSPEVAYSVRWIVQRDERNYTIFKIGEEKHELYGLSLTEEDLVKSHISLPFHVSCAVAENQDTTPKASFSVSSNIISAGIKILTPQVNMRRDETAIIRFSPTVPIGCYSSHMAANDCKLTLAISIPVSKNCTGISTKKCTISISGDEGIEHDLQIQATEDGQYGMLEEITYKVILRTANLKNDTIWNGYIIPAVTVNVKPEIETYWRGKRCEALNEPHMYTFDDVQYEHHESFSDEYVLYTHTSYQAKVHHKLERCNSNAMCNCGIAVLAGRDIYVISTCNNIMEIGYKQCDDGVLLVRQETDSTYTIYLPFGTYVKARLDKSPYFNSVGTMIVSVSLYPSVHDQHSRSRGLCGSLDNNRTNDFHDRTGQISLNRTEFIQTWKVSKEESLFKTSSKSTVPWVHPACTCSVSSGHVTTKDKCHLGADNTCAKGRTVGKQTCELAEQKSIKSSEMQTVPVLDLSKDGNHKDGVTTLKGPEVTNTKPTTKKEAQVSQTTTSTPSEHWDHNKAKSFCTNYE